MVTGVEGTPILFDGSGSLDQDGDTLNYTWDFGDGTPAVTGPEPLHIFTAPGTYHATLTVDNGFGQSSSATVTAVVANVAPTFAPTGYQDPITFSGGSSIGGYGAAVAGFDDRFAVASPGDGIVTLYDLSTGKVRTTFSDPGSGGASDDFGALLATVDGLYLIIGAPGTGSSLTGFGNGAAYLFDADPQSPTFGDELAAFLPASQPGEQGDGFGTSVAGFGLDVLVGAPGMLDSHGIAVGAVYEFDANPTSPTFGQTLLQPTFDPNDVGGDEFGESLAALGGRFRRGRPACNRRDPGPAVRFARRGRLRVQCASQPGGPDLRVRRPGGRGREERPLRAEPRRRRRRPGNWRAGDQYRLSLRPVRRPATRHVRQSHR